MTIEMEFALTRRQYIADYQNLRKQFLNIARPHIVPSVLNTLKTTFSDIISSRRVSDYITNLEGLLRILEKRDALSYNNIEPLKHISSEFVKDPTLERLLNNYEAQNALRDPLPSCNVYALPSGKYSQKGLRIASNFALASNPSIVTGSNRFESVNVDDKNCCNRLLEMHGTNETSSEDNFINETETFIQNDTPTVPINRRKRSNFHIYFAKVPRKLYKKFCMGVAGAVFGGCLAILLLKSFTNVLSVKSVSTTQIESQPNFSGGQTRSNQSQQAREEIHAQLTLYTTQPTFHLTLPGSILFGPSTSRSNSECDSEFMRKVLLEVSEKVGKQWRNLARYLGVKEYDIDEIDYKHETSLQEKAFQALQIFQIKCDPLDWKSKLRVGLEKARRRDLVEMVNKLFEKS